MILNWERQRSNCYKYIKVYTWKIVYNKKYLGRQYLMTKSEKNVGYIDIYFVKSTSVDVVGGLPLPRLSFRPDHIQNLNRVSRPK